MDYNMLRIVVTIVFLKTDQAGLITDKLKLYEATSIILLHFDYDEYDKSIDALALLLW